MYSLTKQAILFIPFFEKNQGQFFWTPSLYATKTQITYYVLPKLNQLIKHTLTIG